MGMAHFFNVDRVQFNLVIQILFSVLIKFYRFLIVFVLTINSISLRGDKKI